MDLNKETEIYYQIAIKVEANYYRSFTNNYIYKI